jgi:hypothetical protein
MYVKLTNESCRHNGLRFKPGLNVDPAPFDPADGEASGIYFCAERDFYRWLFYAEERMHYIWRVDIPDDALVSNDAGGGRLKADRLVLSHCRSVTFFLKQHPEYILPTVCEHYCALDYVECQSEDMCVAAAERNGLALRRVVCQTERICLVAVRQNGVALKDVERQTPRIRMAAVQQDGLALRYADEQTYELCAAAYKQNEASRRYATVERFLLDTLQPQRLPSGRSTPE